MSTPEAAFTAAEFRATLSAFASGVTIVTGAGAQPAGFTCQSFFSVSLDPPLVAISPSVQSASWARVAASGAFTVNVLGSDQDELCLRFGRPGITDRFAGVEWTRGATDAPRLHGAIAWIDCRLDAVHLAGDHLIALGRVEALEAKDHPHPLVFFRSRFAQLSSLPLRRPEWEADLVWGSGPWLPALDDPARSPLEEN
ncbi:MAG: flavin reductase family protein [Microbacterium sp.]|uniref:flavin reductase family protein n=1 Tax=Microbacterium sp. TaxID=51671 RepID=UPI0039E5922D